MTAVDNTKVVQNRRMITDKPRPSFMDPNMKTMLKNADYNPNADPRHDAYMDYRKKMMQAILERNDSAMIALSSAWRQQWGNR